MNKNKQNVVVVFAKKPNKGEVKTRIAEETSDQFAYEFTKTCLVELFYKIGNSDYYDLIVAVDTPKDLSWFQKKFSVDGIIINSNSSYKKTKTQSNKFKKIFSTLLDKNGYNYKKAILIPMDIPFISKEKLIAAFVKLNQKNMC